jgi:hypothetical protein
MMVLGLPTPVTLPGLSPSFSDTPSSSAGVHHDGHRPSDFESDYHVSSPAEAVSVHDQDVAINSLSPGFHGFSQYIDPTILSITQCLPPIPVECMIGGTVEHAGHNETPALGPTETRGTSRERVTETSSTPPKLLYNTSQGSQQRKRDQDLNEAEEPEDNGSSKKPRAYLGGDSVSDKFACPFYKRDPRRYGPWTNIRYRPCVGPGTPEFRRLK